MRICIAGAGAIGGFMGARLSQAGHDVSLVTLGDQLTAIQCAGLRVVGLDGQEDVITDAYATDDFGLLGQQDVVILAVKANHIEAVAASLPQLFHRDTIVVTVQNGIPWWYFERQDGAFKARRIQCLDPDGFISRHIPAHRVIGCVAYPAVETVAPGLLRHVEGTRFPVGELDGSNAPRVHQLADLFIEAGFKSPVLSDIRGEIWLKAVGALAFNPISALTHAYLGDLCRLPETRALALEMMREGEHVAARLGVTIRLPVERRLAGAEAVGAHKTSMLQDIEAGRPLEIEALLSAIRELGQLTRTPTPYINAIYACTKLLDQTLTNAGGRLRIDPVDVADSVA
jgi:2-dehydropantoate 2-reductase